MLRNHRLQVLDKYGLLLLCKVCLVGQIKHACIVPKEIPLGQGLMVTFDPQTLKVNKCRPSPLTLGVIFLGSAFEALKRLVDIDGVDARLN